MSTAAIHDAEPAPHQPNDPITVGPASYWWCLHGERAGHYVVCPNDPAAPMSLAVCDDFGALVPVRSHGAHEGFAGWPVTPGLDRSAITALAESIAHAAPATTAAELERRCAALVAADLADRSARSSCPIRAALLAEQSTLAFLRASQSEGRPSTSH